MVFFKALFCTSVETRVIQIFKCSGVNMPHWGEIVQVNTWNISLVSFLQFTGIHSSLLHSLPGPSPCAPCLFSSLVTARSVEWVGSLLCCLALFFLIWSSPGLAKAWRTRSGWLQGCLYCSVSQTDFWIPVPPMESLSLGTSSEGRNIQTSLDASW